MVFFGRGDENRVERAGIVGMVGATTHLMPKAV